MSRLRSIATAIAVSLVATPLVAQSSPTISDTTVRGAPAASPSVVPSAVIIDRAPSVNPTSSWTNATPIAAVKTPQREAVRAMESGSTPENKALMIVGVSGLIVGGIVGGHSGTVIMIGGTVVGLIGLWNYLK